MPTTANMSLVMPDEDGSLDVWDTILNTLFGVVDAHDHTTGKGVQVPSAGINIDADIPAGTNAITGLRAIDFTAVAAATVAGYAGAFFVNSADSELYYRTTSGSNVKITNGASLNVATFAGGIGGDYSAVSALLDYDDATDTYRFRQEVSSAVRQYGKISSADLKLFEYKAAGDPSVPSFGVTLQSPAALAASYTLTLPGALPGSTLLMQCSSAGVVTFSNTINSLVLNSNQTITLAGTGRVILASMNETVILEPTGTVTGGTTNWSTGAPGVVQDASTTAYYQLSRNQSKRRILSVEVTSGTSANSTVYSLVTGGGSGAPAFSADLAGTSNTTSADSAVLTPNTPAVISDGLNIYVKVVTAAATTRHLVAAIITYAMD